MSEKRIAANRRNAKVSTGPTSRSGKQRSALNALKHGLNIGTNPVGADVRALAVLLSPAAASDHIARLALEAARLIIDFDRVREAHQHVYSRLGSSPSLAASPARSSAELTGLSKSAANLIKELQPPKLSPLAITDVAKQLDKLARYERRALSSRERALRELADVIASNKNWS
jgi:hypothetical protein